MSDCDTGATAPWEDCSSTTDTSMDCSSFVESPPDCSSSVEPPPHCSNYDQPPPDYSTCVSNSERERWIDNSETADTTRHSHDCCRVSEDGLEAFPLEEIHHNALGFDNILHEAALSHTLLDVTPESEHFHHKDVPRISRYNPRPFYKPSYMMNMPNSSRPRVYRDTARTINRVNTAEPQISTGESNDHSCECLVVPIFSIISAILIFAAISRLANVFLN